MTRTETRAHRPEAGGRSGRRRGVFGAWAGDAAAGTLMVLLRAYQVAVSPWLPPACRYSPTCSEYAIEAVRRHGAARGGWMALRRLARCHPFHSGGFDPVR